MFLVWVRTVFRDSTSSRAMDGPSNSLASSRMTSRSRSVSGSRRRSCAGRLNAGVDAATAFTGGRACCIQDAAQVGPSRPPLVQRGEQHGHRLTLTDEDPDVAFGLSQGQRALQHFERVTPVIGCVMRERQKREDLDDRAGPAGTLGRRQQPLEQPDRVGHQLRGPVGRVLGEQDPSQGHVAADAYTLWALQGNGPGSSFWAHVIAWASPLLGWPAFAALIMVFLISPTGHLASPGWRWALWATLAGLGLRTLGNLTTSPGDFVYAEQYDGFTLSTVLLTMGYLLVAAGLIASAVSLVLRLRKARDDERRQILWIASSAEFLALGVVIILVVPRVLGEQGTWLAGLPLRLAQLAVPLCVAVAVLRHRLLEIDLIVNRALLVALATGLARIGYVSVVVVIGSAVGGGAGGFWPSLIATALVAIGFQPLRRRVVRVADRLAFGAAAAPYEALADFSRRLGDRPDPAALLPAVAEAAARAVNAGRAVVSLHVEGGPDRVAAWPPLGHEDAAASRVATPVIDHKERLGSITVEMAAGHPLRPRDQRLLADLADQAAMAFRNAQLTAELSAEVERLSAHTHDLDQSRARLITAGDAERSRVERAIARQVIPHLAPLPDRLRQLSQSHPEDSHALNVTQLAPLLTSMNTAMASLREITRGVFPAQLTRSGLPTALGSLLARPGLTGPQSLTVEDSAVGLRFDPRVEAAVYFCVAEATRAFEDPVAVVLSVHAGELHLSVSGTDRGGLSMHHMRDRIGATGGSVSTTGRNGRTVVEVRAPSARPLAVS
jgi:GAF domain-containing protein